MSDRGIPRSYRHMHGFGSHTYSFINADNVRHWVKFHFVTQQGIENLTDEEAGAVIGSDRESHQRDLFEAIGNGDFPKWKMYIQIMTEEQAEQMSYNPFDLTKVWYKGDFPLIPVGEFELNRNPDNYFQDVEQAAFNPANVVPGIGFSPDKMLQGRLFSYGDAQRYRLGVNHHQIPVNYPRGVKGGYNSYHRDGQMRMDGNHGATLHYEPNSYNVWQEQPEHDEPVQKVNGDIKRERIDQSYSRIMKLKSRLNAQSTIDQYQVLAAKEKLRADQLQMKIDQMNADQAANSGRKKKKKKKRNDNP